MRRWIGPTLGLVVVVAAVVALWTYHLTARDGASTLVLAEVSGTVHLTGPDQVEPLVATSGVELDAMQRVATGEDARAVLALGRETRIRLGPSASVQVREIDDDGVRLELEDGALQATVRPNSGALRVSNKGREILATDADLQAGVGDGNLAFEVDRGDAMVLGVEGASHLTAGQRLLVPAADGPILSAVPDDLLLTVTWPQEHKTREESLELSGETEPGARVRVSGGAEDVLAVADADGAFQVTVPLREGQNAVRVESRGLFGESRHEEGEIEKDTLAPAFGGGIEYVKP